MKNIYLFFAFILLTSISLNSQTDCEAGEASTKLAVNNIDAGLLNSGDMFWDLSNGKYEYPAGSDKNLMFAAALWMGGTDDMGELHMAAQTYRQSGTDFFSGPISNDSTSCIDFDRFWSVDGTVITSFLTAFDANEIIAETDVDSILLGWPGKNNPYFSNITGFDLAIDKDFAPFWDENEDGVYNPLDGDYPVIDSEVAGVYADQMIWWMFNDAANEHIETGGLPIEMEVGVLAYAWSSNDYRNNATFYRYTFNYKGEQNLSDFYIGQWVDGDLGNFEDDFIGCDTTENMGYFYNGDDLDDELNGYGDEIPMIGVKLLEDLDGNNDDDIKMSSFIYYNNDFDVTGNPESSSDYYNYLQGKWKDGTPFTQGGNGYGGEIPTQFVYPSNPIDPNGWSECSESNPPADRRFMINMGPFDLTPGESRSATVAYIVAPEDQITYPCPSTDILVDISQQADSFYQQQQLAFYDTVTLIMDDTTSWVTSIEDITLMPTSVYPNPAQEYIVLAMKELKDFKKDRINIIDNLGRIIKVIKTDPVVDDQRVVVGDLPDGIYFYEILDNADQVLSVGKFLISQ